VPEFYREIGRVLKSGGIFIISLPNLIWGEALRSAEGIPGHETVFIDNRGSRVITPSFLISDDELRKRLELADFAVLGIETGRLPLHIKQQCTSPHVLIAARELNVSPHEVPLVTVAVAEKR
jgi:SAM-dependent methyltransferase